MTKIMPQKLANEMSKSERITCGNPTEIQPREPQWENIVPRPRAGKKPNLSHNSSSTTQSGSITQSLTQSKSQSRTQSTINESESEEDSEEETQTLAAKSFTTESSVSKKSIGSKGGLTITSQPKSQTDVTQTSVYERRNQFENSDFQSVQVNLDLNSEPVEVFNPLSP